MKKQLLLLLLLLPSVMMMSSCSKNSDSTPEVVAVKPSVFSIKNIQVNTTKPIAGQRVTFKAELTDSTGNINYEWQLLQNGVQLGKSTSGLNIKTVQFNPASGDYTIKLIITRGSSDVSTTDTKISVTQGNFVYGEWGDSEATIKTAESDNGYKENEGLIGIPTIIAPNNEGLTTLIYYKDNRYYTYYFKAGKLYAGAYTQSYSYANQNTDLRGVYSQFYTEKTKLEKALGTTITESLTWKISDQSQINFWKSTNDNKAIAVGLNYLQLDATSKSSLGTGGLSLYKNTATVVTFRYTLVSPN